MKPVLAPPMARVPQRLGLRLRPLLLACAAAGSGAMLSPVGAAETGAKPAAKAAAQPSAKPAARPSAKPVRPAPPATPRDRLADRARGLALAKTTVTQITAGQLDVAGRVLTGTADCEFKQQVRVQAIDGQAGHFQVQFQNRRFTMVPEETQTGAVRLEDKAAGVVWLQIPTKSMLMDGRRGQRLVDSCLHAEQRIAVQAAADAAHHAPPGSGLGIAVVPQAAATPATATPTIATPAAAPLVPATPAAAIPAAVAVPAAAPGAPAPAAAAAEPASAAALPTTAPSAEPITAPAQAPAPAASR